MKYQFLLIAIIWLVSCHNNENIAETEEYPDLVGAFGNSIFYSLNFTTSASDTLFLYNKFANTASRHVLEEIYTSFYDYLEYEINDSLLQLIVTRPDREFSGVIIPHFSFEPTTAIKMISDTTNLLDYMYVSEPFDIDSNWLLFSITHLSSTTGEREHYVSYVEKNVINDLGQLNLAYIYDWQKDRLLKSEAIK